MLDYDGEIKHRDSQQKMELIQQDDLFDVSVLDAIRFSGEDYEKRVDAIISSDYVNKPQDGKKTRNTTMEDCFIVEDPIRAHVDTMDANLDGNLLNSALSDRLKISKLDLSIGSMTEKMGVVSCLRLIKVNHGKMLIPHHTVIRKG